MEGQVPPGPPLGCWTQPPWPETGGRHAACVCHVCHHLVLKLRWHLEMKAYRAGSQGQVDVVVLARLELSAEAKGGGCRGPPVLPPGAHS